MSNAVRLGDKSTGHDCHPPQTVTSASSNVVIGGKHAMRKGDSYSAHACPDSPPHSGIAISGSGTVKINGLDAIRKGDPVSCGGVAATGESTVIIGD